jgi:hypothetical protein
MSVQCAMVLAMTRTLAARLPPSTGWSWQVMRRDELSLAWPLLLIVEGRNTETRLAEADAWIAARGRRGGLIAVRCALGTIAGLFFFEVQTTQGGDYLLADRLILVDLFGSHRTLAALLRATRELGEIHACREIRVLPPDDQALPAVEGVIEVARRLGFVRGDRYWHLDLEAVSRRMVHLWPGR